MILCLAKDTIMVPGNGEEGTEEVERFQNLGGTPHSNYLEQKCSGGV